MDKVHRRATKMIRGYKSLSHKEGLKRCGLTTVEKRGSKGYLIKITRLITGRKQCMQWKRFFELGANKGD